MNDKKNGYATNKGGFIKAPNTPAKGDPTAGVTTAKGGKDLRVGK